jgi:hypothetical protein
MRFTLKLNSIALSWFKLRLLALTFFAALLLAVPLSNPVLRILYWMADVA